MNKIYKSNADHAPVERIDRQLIQYLQQVLPKQRIHSGKGSLALLVPLAASGLISNQLNAQACIFPVNNGAAPGDVFIDIDGDGLATFLLTNVNAAGNYQHARVVNGVNGDPTGPANAGIDASLIMTSGGTYFFVQAAGAGTTYALGATLNFNGGDALTGGGTFNVQDANGVTVPINITIAAGTGVITVNTINGVAPPTCAMLPLPIELVNFTLAPNGKSLQLSWKTATESNNQGFEIERSTDGLRFRKIGWVNGAGNSSESTPYTFEDKSIKTNVEYYYRLKQMDFDGRSSTSSIVQGMVKGDAAIQFGELFPNPVNAAVVRVEVIATAENALLYTLYDQLGKVVLQGHTDLQAGLNNLRVPVQGVANGNYYLKMQVGEVSEYKKVVIQK